MGVANRGDVQVSSDIDGICKSRMRKRRHTDDDEGVGKATERVGVVRETN